MGLEALLDRILVTAGKGGEHQLAAIGVALMHGQFVAIFNRLDHAIDVRKIEARIDTLRVHVQSDRHEAAIAGSFAIAKQASFDAVRASHHAQLCRRDTRTAIIMRVQADRRALPIGQISAEIFDLVRVDIGRCRLDRGWQVEDNRAIWRRLQHLHHRLANLDAEIQFSG